MNLTPKLPPGRSNRKALAYAVEIHRLRAGGYSFEAIRQALRDAGVEVSLTTVKREAAKRPVPIGGSATLPRHRPRPASSSSSPRAFASETPLETAPVPLTYVGDARSGRQIADAFMQGRITNPLMQKDEP